MLPMGQIQSTSGWNWDKSDNLAFHCILKYMLQVYLSAWGGYEHKDIVCEGGTLDRQPYFLL